MRKPTIQFRHSLVDANTNLGSVYTHQQVDMDENVMEKWKETELMTQMTKLWKRNDNSDDGSENMTLRK